MNQDSVYVVSQSWPWAVSIHFHCHPSHVQFISLRIRVGSEYANSDSVLNVDIWLWCSLECCHFGGLGISITSSPLGDKRRASHGVSTCFCGYVNEHSITLFLLQLHIKAYVNLPWHWHSKKETNIYHTRNQTYFFFCWNGTMCIKVFQHHISQNIDIS